MTTPSPLFPKTPLTTPADDKQNSASPRTFTPTPPATPATATAATRPLPSPAPVFKPTTDPGANKVFTPASATPGTFAPAPRPATPYTPGQSTLTPTATAARTAQTASAAAPFHPVTHTAPPPVSPVAADASAPFRSSTPSITPASAPSPFRSTAPAATGQNTTTSPFRSFSPSTAPAPIFSGTPSDAGRAAPRPAFQPRTPEATIPCQRQPIAPSCAFKSPADATAAKPAASTSLFRKDLQVSMEEFIQLRDFIYQQCGIYIGENRKYLVENRLSIRIKELNLKSFSEYYNYLRFDANKRNELTRLYEVVTTNETSFFRNPPQLEVFQDVVLTKILEDRRKAGKKSLRIWSAGCSSGEEPYTLAIILHEVLKGEISSWDIKITANDLSEAVLESAKRGVYTDYALRTTPKEMIDKYFTPDGALFKINPGPKRLVTFGPINLNDKEQCRRVEKSQIVFCRNVIIYFDDDMKRRVINAYYDNLEPGGVLLIGHSESLHNISRAFQLEQHKGTMVYRKMG